MIRQAISCDICGTEKRQTNHWFVAYEQAGELRVSGWTSRRRLRADSKHLCGQTCLHKLVDDFMAKSIASRTKPAEENVVEPIPFLNDTSLNSVEPRSGTGFPARMIEPGLPNHEQTSSPQPESIAEPVPFQAPLLDRFPADPARYDSQTWRAEAWQRERERELRAREHI